MNQSLHPDVKKFKAFVKKHPFVLKDVKKGEKTLQDLFEEWMLFGEDDEIWSSYKNSSDTNEDHYDEEDNPSSQTDNEKAETDLLNMLKKMNLNDLQHHLAQFSTVMGSVQELFSQFKQNEQANPPPESNPDQQPPFAFRDD